MSASFEQRFSVSIEVERVWQVMTDPAELNEWYFPFRVDGDGTTHTEIAGTERAARVVEFEPNRMFRLRTTLTGLEGWPPLPPTERDMTVVLEATDTGTTVVITHSGFGEGDDWAQVLDSTMRGAAETTADLILYLETGVGIRRHPNLNTCTVGIGARVTGAGLAVMSVQPGTFADRLGLTAGDILVELGGAGVFGFHEVNFFQREHEVGDTANAAWVRGGKLMRGSAELGARLPVEFRVGSTS